MLPRALHMINDAMAYVLIFLFVYTASSKLIDHAVFVSVLKTSPILKHYALPLSFIIPVVELVISAFLFFPATREKGLALSLWLLAGFTVYIGFMMLFYPHLPCSCGGIIQSLSWGQHLFLNGTLIAVLIGLRCAPVKCLIYFIPDEYKIARFYPPVRNRQGRAGDAENLYKRVSNHS